MISGKSSNFSQFRLDAWSICAVLFAASLQVLATLQIGETRLRASTSDLFLPAVGLAVLVLWVRQGMPRPRWRLRHLCTWLVILTLWLAIALVNGRLQLGTWDTWAVVNKFVGWLVLIGYFLVGGLITQLRDSKTSDAFLGGFVAFGWMVCAVTLLFYALAMHSAIPRDESFYFPRLSGFFANPNAFAIATSAVVVLSLTADDKSGFFAPWLRYVGSAVAMSCIFLTGSRSAWIGLILGLAVMTLIRIVRQRDVAIVIGMCIAITGATLYGPPLTANVVQTIDTMLTYEPTESVRADAPAPTAALRQIRRSTYATQVIEHGLTDSGITTRLESVRLALQSWSASPVVGVGLGTYYGTHRGRAETGQTIHNTGLWLLTETGLIGATLFSVFSLVILWTLIKSVPGSGASSPLLRGTIGVLVVLGGASVGTEVMYQRYIWVLLGLALAQPTVKEQSIPAAEAVQHSGPSS